VDNLRALIARDLAEAASLVCGLLMGVLGSADESGWARPAFGGSVTS
jgi:hypothetical protein